MVSNAWTLSKFRTFAANIPPKSPSPRPAVNEDETPVQNTNQSNDWDEEEESGG